MLFKLSLKVEARHEASLKGRVVSKASFTQWFE